MAKGGLAGEQLDVSEERRLPSVRKTTQDAGAGLDDLFFDRHRQGSEQITGGRYSVC